MTLETALLFLLLVIVIFIACSFGLGLTKAKKKNYRPLPPHVAWDGDYIYVKPGEMQKQKGFQGGLKWAVAQLEGKEAAENVIRPDGTFI